MQLLLPWLHTAVTTMHSTINVLCCAPASLLLHCTTGWRAMVGKT
jgi:hypothetical protein